MRFASLVLLLTMVSAAPFRARVDAQDIVEVLKDAQATNRDAWKRGRAAFRLEITKSQKPGVAVMEGDLRWNEADLLVKYKMSDPEGIYFPDRAKGKGDEWNYVARGPKKAITYLAHQNVLKERAPTPNAFEPLFDISPPTTFARCCPPNGLEGSPWQETIGPSASIPEVLRASKFTHATLPGGDVEQTRIDEDGGKFVVTFSARHNLAVLSAIRTLPDGRIGNEHQYRYYAKAGDGPVIPSGVNSTWRSADLSTSTTYSHTFTDVRLPGDVSAGDFSREAVLARINREPARAKRAQARPSTPVVDDASLDAQAKSLREGGSARPRP